MAGFPSLSKGFPSQLVVVRFEIIIQTIVKCNSRNNKFYSIKNTIASVVVLRLAIIEPVWYNSSWYSVLDPLKNVGVHVVVLVHLLFQKLRPIFHQILLVYNYLFPSYAFLNFGNVRFYLQINRLAWIHILVFKPLLENSIFSNNKNRPWLLLKLLNSLSVILGSALNHIRCFWIKIKPHLLNCEPFWSFSNKLESKY